MDDAAQLPGDRDRSTATCSRSPAAGPRWCTCTASARAGCAGTRTWRRSCPAARSQDQQIAGAVNGTYWLTGCLAEGAPPARRQPPAPASPAARTRRRSRAAAADRPGTVRAAVAGPRPGRRARAGGDNHFVDLQRDQTVADVLRSTGAGHAQRGARQALHLDQHRPTTRARPRGVNAIGVIAAALNERSDLGRDRHHRRTAPRTPRWRSPRWPAASAGSCSTRPG